MQDLRKIFRYARPYRRDLFAAVGLIFIECIFEMVIPVLMSTLVDDGVPAHNMAVIFRQGGLMILCAVLALITGCCMRGTRRGSQTGSRRSCAWRSMPPCRNSTSPTSTASPMRPRHPHDHRRHGHA